MRAGKVGAVVFAETVRAAVFGPDRERRPPIRYRHRAGRYRHPLPQHPHHGTFSARSLMLSFRRQIVLVSLSASSVRDTDPPRCLLAIVSRLWPACITDGRRRARSGDSPGPGVGGHPSRSLVTTLDSRLGDPVDLTEADDCNDDDGGGAVTLGSAAFGSAGNLFTTIAR